jgi:hypothetical protein
MSEEGHTLPHHRLLSKLYYDADQTTAYTGKNAIYVAAKKIDSSITHKNVNDWFMSQPAATVWKQAKKKLHRNPYIQVALTHVYLLSCNFQTIYSIIIF